MPSRLADPSVAEGADVALAPSRRFWIVAALVAVLVGAIAFAGGALLARPHYPAEGSADVGFARDMSAHHAQAVSMGIEEHAATSDKFLRDISIDIALTQQAQIGMMGTWLDDWGLPAHTDADPMAWMPSGSAELKDGLMPGMASQDTMTKFRAATGKEKDIMFCQLMISHHLGGIHMIEGALKAAHDERLLRLARGMKAAQQYEIQMLQDQLKRVQGS